MDHTAYVLYGLRVEILVESRKFRPARSTFGASINDSSLEFHYYIGVDRCGALGAHASLDNTNIFQLTLERLCAVASP